MARTFRSPLSWIGLTGVSVVLVMSGCRSPGPYGYARTYVPTEVEQKAAVDARPLDLVMAQRRREAWESQPVSLYGVVSKVQDRKAGQTHLIVSLHRLQKRNLCRAASEESCRVTVSDRSFGSVLVSVQLDPSDVSGPDRVDVGSLLRVIGTLELPPEGSDSRPAIEAMFYRQWPAKHYVTTAARKYMRR